MARSFASTDKLSSSSITSPGNKGSISIWVKPNWSSGDANDHYFVEYDDSVLSNFIMLFHEGTSGKVLGGWFTSSDSRATATDVGLFTSGTWVNVACTWDLTTPLNTLYINGVSKATNSTASSAVTLIDVGVGNKSFTNNGYVNGSLADAAVWSVQLTAAEILALSVGARPYTVRPGKLIAYWPLDGLASPEPDLSGNAKNLTITGTALASGPPFMQFTPRWPQFNTVVAAAGGVKWEIFMRHSMLPMLLAANPQMTRRQAAILLGLAKEL